MSLRLELCLLGLLGLIILAESASISPRIVGGDQADISDYRFLYCSCEYARTTDYYSK